MAVTYSQHGVIVKPTGFDVIGGKKYKTVQMPDGKIWLAENLDLRLSANDLYYNNDESTYGWNGRKYGLLYDFKDCTWLKSYLNEFYPAWRLPTDNEVADLVSSVNGDKAKLKSVQYWTTSGTDNYGFNAMPSGIWDGSFYDESFTMCFKTTGTASSGRMYLMVISDNPNVYQSDVINVSDFSDTNKMSIRLVRDT